MIRSGHGPFHAKEACQTAPEGRTEEFVTVGHDAARNTMEPDNVTTKDDGQLRGGDGDTTGREMDHFGELVGEDDDLIVTRGCGGKAGNEVHSDVVPNAIRNREGVKEALWFSRAVLDGLARVALADVTLDISGHVRPPEPAGEQLKSSGTTRMTGGGGVMGQGDAMEAGLLVVGNGYGSAPEIQVTGLDELGGVLGGTGPGIRVIPGLHPGHKDVLRKEAR